MGPTAVGKSDIAMQISERGSYSLISVDSALVYRGMNIGTAKPSAAMLDKYPHTLLDILDPTETFSAADFCSAAHAEITAAEKSQKTPILVGGTMMYFRALQQGLALLPPADQRVRTALEQRLEKIGNRALHAELAEVDADSAARINPNDPQRLLRALEVYQLAGKSLTQLHAEQVTPRSHNFINIALLPRDRAELHVRIAQRFDSMIEAGFLDEMQKLYTRGDLTPSLPSMRSVGYRQGWLYCTGEYDFATFREKTIVATRQLAKRQLTWLRGWPDIHDVIVDETLSNTVEKIVSLLNATTTPPVFRG